MLIVGRKDDQAQSLLAVEYCFPLQCLDVMASWNRASSLGMSQALSDRGHELSSDSHQMRLSLRYVVLDLPFEHAGRSTESRRHVISKDTN